MSEIQKKASKHKSLKKTFSIRTFFLSAGIEKPHSKFAFFAHKQASNAGFCEFLFQRYFRMRIDIQSVNEREKRRKKSSSRFLFKFSAGKKEEGRICMNTMLGYSIEEENWSFFIRTTKVPNILGFFIFLLFILTFSLSGNVFTWYGFICTGEKKRDIFIFFSNLTRYKADRGIFCGGLG